MTNQQKIICYGLLFLGMLFFPILNLVIGHLSYSFAWIGFGLMAIGGMYGVVVLWKAKRYDKFRRACLSLGVMALTLAILYITFG